MVSELFLRGLTTAVSGCRTPGNRECDIWHIVVFQFDSMCFSASASQLGQYNCMAMTEL